jgi:cytochrome c5
MRKRWIPIVSLFLIAIFIGYSRQTITTAKAKSSQNGQNIFRFDTFGDEQLWTDTLQMQKAISQVSPKTALSVGLKVDSDALPQEIIDAIKANAINLDDPTVTIQLLKLNAVVGVIGKVAGPNDKLVTVGITCALCHSTVDDSVAPGIGKRRDGWPNRSLNVGAIIALSPAVTDKTPFNSWGRGKFDPRLQAFDGHKLISLNPTTLPVVIPPAFGLQGIRFETFTADGPISYWNDYVGVTQMGGHGSFSDPRIGLKVNQQPDLVTPKLPALLEYQLSLQTPAAPADFDAVRAERGKTLFHSTTAKCSTCHQAPLLTDVGSGPSPVLHNADEIGVEAEYAKRSATKGYRTTPLRALWQHPPYFHDGSAADLRAVVEHYNGQFKLGLTEEQKLDLIEYLKTL